MCHAGSSPACSEGLDAGVLPRPVASGRGPRTMAIFHLDVAERGPYPYGPVPDSDLETEKRLPVIRNGRIINVSPTAGFAPRAPTGFSPRDAAVSGRPSTTCGVSETATSSDRSVTVPSQWSTGSTSTGHARGSRSDRTVREDRRTFRNNDTRRRMPTLVTNPNATVARSVATGYGLHQYSCNNLDRHRSSRAGRRPVVASLRAVSRR